MGKLITVSNRLAVSVSKGRDGISVKPSVGGVASGLSSLYGAHEKVWVGWPGLESGRLNDKELREIKRLLKKENYVPVFLSKYEIDGLANDYLDILNELLC